MNNLPSGYFRDLQIIKEVFLPAFQELKECLQMAAYIMDKIKSTSIFWMMIVTFIYLVWKRLTVWLLRACHSVMLIRRWAWI